MSTQELATRQNQIKTLLLQSQRQIQSLLQDETRAKKFLAASLVVANDPALRNCSADSIVQALIGVALADLSVDKNLGQAYLVPYKDSVTLQIGYKGWITLLWRSGWMVKAMPVFHCDKFTMEFNGWDNKVNFVPDIDNRDEGDKDWAYQNLRGVFVVARHTETKDEYSLFVSKNVIEKLRLNSPNQKIGNYTKPDDKKRLEAGFPIQIWADWYIEMALAKSLKKISKLLPLGDSRAATSIYADDKSEIGTVVDYKRTAETGVVTEAIDTEYSSSTSENPEALDKALTAIEKAGSKAEIDVVLSLIDGLAAADQKIARAKWMAKVEDLKKTKAGAKKTEPKPKETKETKTKTAEKDPDPDSERNWQVEIDACRSRDELNRLLNEVPEGVYMDLNDFINDKLDSFRD